MDFLEKLNDKTKENGLFIFVFFLVLNLIPHFFVSISDSGYLLNWYTSDDSYYYFKTAQNIVSGKGITFDGINPTNGFHPLWMAICVPVFYLTRVNLFLPLRVLVIIQSVLNAGSGYFLYRIFSIKGKAITGFILAFLWMFSFSVHEITTKAGMESGINAFSILFFLFLISSYLHSDSFSSKREGNLFIIGLSSVLVLFSRLDNIFLVGIIGIWLIFQDSQIRWMALVDFLIILVSVTVSFFLRLQFSGNIFQYVSFMNVHLVLSLILRPVFNYFLGLYEIKRNKIFKFSIRIFISTFLSAALIYVIMYLISNFSDRLSGFPRSIILIDAAIAFVLMLLFRSILFLMKKQKYITEKNIPLGENFPNWIKRTALYFLPVLLLMSLYLLINHIVFDAAFPVSGQIKRWWGTLPNTIYGDPIETLSGVFSSLFITSKNRGPFWLFWQPLNLLFELFPEITKNQVFSNLLYWIYVLLWLSALIILLGKIRKGIIEQIRTPNIIFPLFAATIFHAFYYKTTGYLQPRYWYWIGEMIFLFLVSGKLVSFLFQDFAFTNLHKKYLGLFSAAFCVLIFLSFSYGLISRFYFQSKMKPLYNINKEKQFLDRHTREGDMIGMTAAGLLGYFYEDRTVVNLDGLINSAEYFEAMKNGTAYIFLEKLGLQYVYGSEYVLLDSDPYRWIFTDRLEFIEKGPSFTLLRFGLAD